MLQRHRARLLSTVWEGHKIWAAFGESWLREPMQPVGTHVRGAVPGRAPGRAERTAAVMLVAIALGLLSQEPAHPVSLTDFVAMGTGCFISTLFLGMLPWATLFIAVRRGAPLAARRVGADAGAAALLFAVAATRLSCRAEDSLHLIVWHGVPVVFGVTLSAVAGAAWLGAWRAESARPRPSCNPTAQPTNLPIEVFRVQARGTRAMGPQGSDVATQHRPASVGGAAALSQPRLPDTAPASRAA